VDVFFHPDQLRHEPRFFLMRGQVVRHFEVPARAMALLEAVREAGLRVVAPTPVDQALLSTVHSPDYLAFLRDGYAAWRALPDAGEEIVPNIHPTPEMLAQGGRAGPGMVARAGWHLADTACAIGEHAWSAALAAAACAAAAAQRVLAGARAAYALTRPPGHHAYAARAGGHCYLNNAAIAAEALLRGGAARVAVLDIDVHHGNGTQGIFWERGDVLTVSVHGDPDGLYPWYVGRAEERGSGAGDGCNLNLPLPPGTEDGPWLAAIDTGIAAIRRFRPDALVLALGFDPSVEEPLGSLRIGDDGFARAARAAAALDLPTVITQEGGYAVAALGRLFGRFLAGWGG
jgi:acetoin utilization deacetylase AcuC-like enzyme